MSTPQYHSSVSTILFKELTSKYEEISPDEITHTILQNGNDRAKCIEVLERLSDQCLYSSGENTPAPTPPPRPPPPDRIRHRSGGSSNAQHNEHHAPPLVKHSQSTPYISQHHAYVSGAPGAGGDAASGGEDNTPPPVPPPTYRSVSAVTPVMSERPPAPLPPQTPPEHRQTEYHMAGKKVTVTMGKPGTVPFPRQTPETAAAANRTQAPYWQVNSGQYVSPQHLPQQQPQQQQAQSGYSYYSQQQPPQQTWQQQPAQKPHIVKPSHFHQSFPHQISNNSASPQHPSPSTPPRTLYHEGAVGSPVKSVSPLYPYPPGGTVTYTTPPSHYNPAGQQTTPPPPSHYNPQHQAAAGGMYQSSVSMHVGGIPAGSMHYPQQTPGLHNSNSSNTPSPSQPPPTSIYYGISPSNYPPQKQPFQAWGSPVEGSMAAAAGTPEGPGPSPEHMMSRPRTGSVEDTQYINTLLEYQQQQRDKVCADLAANEDVLSALKQSIVELNKKLVKRERRPRSGITTTDIQSLRDENKRLKMAITFMAQQIDAMTSEQEAKLGWTEANVVTASTTSTSHTATTTLPALSSRQQQSFYHNISPGPSGSFNSSEEAEQLRTALALSRLEAGNTTNPGASQLNTHRYTSPSVPPSTAAPHQSHGLPHHHHQPSPLHRPPVPNNPSPLVARPPQQVSGEEEETWSCGACTFNNHVALEMCEMCDMPRAGGRDGDGGGRLRGGCASSAVHYISPYNAGGPPSYDTVDSSSPAAASSS